MNFDGCLIRINHKPLAVDDSHIWEATLENEENVDIAFALGSSVRQALYNLAVWTEEQELDED